MFVESAAISPTALQRESIRANTTTSVVVTLSTQKISLNTMVNLLNPFRAEGLAVEIRSVEALTNLRRKVELHFT